MSPQNASNISPNRFASKTGNISSSSSDSSSSDSSSSDSDSDSHNASIEESDDIDINGKNKKEDIIIENVTQQKHIFHAQSTTKSSAINANKVRKYNHRRVVSAMPSIQGL